MLNKMQISGLQCGLEIIKKSNAGNIFSALQSIKSILDGFDGPDVAYIKRRASSVAHLYMNGHKEEGYVEIFSSELEAFLSLASEE